MSFSLFSILSSNSTIPNSVFYYLLDSDLRTFGQTSTKMNDVVKKEFEARNLKLKELLAPYLVSREFSILNSKHPSKFLVGDRHGNPNCLKALSRLVGHLSRRAPVFFIAESLPSMKPCQADYFFDPDFTYAGAEKSFPLLVSNSDEVIFKENIYGLGWNVKKDRIEKLLIREMKDLNTQRMRSKQGLVTKAKVMSSLVPEELCAPALWKKLGVTQDLLDRLSKEKRSDLLNRYYRNFATLFLNQVSAYVKNNFKEIGINNNKLLLACWDYSDLYTDVKSRDSELKKKLSDVREKLKSRVDSKIDRSTASMVSTLKQIESYRLSLKIQEHFTVVSAGICHLENSSNGGAEYDLRPLYEELETITLRF